MVSCKIFNSTRLYVVPEDDNAPSKTASYDCYRTENYFCPVRCQVGFTGKVPVQSAVVSWLGPRSFGSVGRSQHTADNIGA